MKAKKIIGAIRVAAASIAMMGNPQAATIDQNQSTVQHETKATTRDNKVQSKKVIRNVGGSGLDLVTVIDRGSGLPPKEYGIRYGNGKSRIGKMNMLHVSRKAKFKK